MHVLCLVYTDYLLLVYFSGIAVCCIIYLSDYYFNTYYFRYMKGGVTSGFNHVEQKVTQRLLHIKGRHHVRCEEVEKTWSSFNDGDVFILDLGKVQFVWMGKEASRTERIKVSGRYS